MATEAMARSGNPVTKSSQEMFFRNSSFFSISLTLGGLCAIIRSFFLAKYLGPQAFGTWRFINLFLDYLRLASLGTQPAMTQRVPFLRGRGDLQQTNLILHTVFVTTFFTSILYSGAVFAWSFTLTDILTSRALAAFSPVLFLFAWLSFAQEFFLATELYASRSRLEILHAISLLVLSVPLLFWGGILGAIFALGISTSLTLALSARPLFQQFSLRFKWHCFWDLVFTGLPMLANGMSILTMANADRIMIAMFLGNEMLGIYSISNAGLTILGMIPSAIGQMFFVKLSELNGQNKSLDYISNFLDRNIFVFSVFFSLITSTVLILFPPAVILLLPEYIEGIHAGTLLLTGAFFFAVSLPASNWLMSARYFRTVLSVRFVVLAIEFLTLYLLVKAGATLESIALCVLFSFVIFHIVIMFISYSFFRKGLLYSFHCTLKSVSPCINILAVITIQFYIYPLGLRHSALELSVYGGLEFFLVSMVSIPFICWANEYGQLSNSRLFSSPLNFWQRKLWSS